MSTRLDGDGDSPIGSRLQAEAAARPKSDPTACAFCGLPAGQDAAAPHEQPAYCCFGCQFAASIAASSGDEAQARWAMTRLGMSVFFSMNVMVFTMLLWSQPAGEADQLAGVWYDLARYACLLFTVPVVILLGGPLASDAAAELLRGRPSLSLLLLVGVAAALFTSIWSLLEGDGHVYFEVACTILVATTLGRWLEATGKLKTTAALRMLARLMPDSVRLIREGREVIVPAAELRAGDRFRALPGERIAADGEIILHQSSLDEQVVTGESLPVTRGPGEVVLSGVLVLDGPLEIVARSPAGEGMLARIVAAVTEATRARSRYERLAEQISRWFLPLVAAIATATLAAHWWMGDATAGLLAALAVLTIACPCALGLATPMALWAAIGRAAQAGVLIREGDALAQLARAKIVCFDKTGTLTTGQAQVDCAQFRSSDEGPLALQAAAALASCTSHPLAVAITAYAAELHSSMPRQKVCDVQVVPGGGVRGHLANLGGVAYLGSRQWLIRQSQLCPADWRTSASNEHAETLTAWDGIVRGRFFISQQVRPEAAEVVASLARADVRAIMLTGDRTPRARALGRELGLDVLAELLPTDKLAAIEELKRQGPVAMIGDGINDAPALAAADIGIALGSGTDISRHTAGVCLLHDNLLLVPWLIQLAAATVKTVRWNLVWAFAYNLLGIGLAATGWLHPIVAALAMALSGLLVVGNSLALAQFKLPKQPESSDMPTEPAVSSRPEATETPFAEVEVAA